MEYLNSLDYLSFVHTLGGIVEQCPLAAAAVWDQRPFEDVDHLVEAFRAFLQALSTDGQRGVLRLHPELGQTTVSNTKEAEGGNLSAESKAEQSRAGLLSLPQNHFTELSQLNARYREKFGFPFVVCVAQAGDRVAVVEILRQRLSLGQEEGNTEVELHRGVAAVASIARIRILQVIDSLQNKGA